MHSQSSATLPDTLGLIVREYLKALRPEVSGCVVSGARPLRQTGEIIVPWENASSRGRDRFSPGLNEAFRRSARTKR
jgi:hypothetical protein